MTFDPLNPLADQVPVKHTVVDMGSAMNDIVARLKLGPRDRCLVEVGAQITSLFQAASVGVVRLEDVFDLVRESVEAAEKSGRLPLSEFYGRANAMLSRETLRLRRKPSDN